MRVTQHPILGAYDEIRTGTVTIVVDGVPLCAMAGETVAAALLANGIRVFRGTKKYGEPRGLFCGIGQCHDCAMTIDGVPDVRSCVTKVRDGMVVETGRGGEKA